MTDLKNRLTAIEGRIPAVNEALVAAAAFAIRSVVGLETCTATVWVSLAYGASSAAFGDAALGCGLVPLG